MSYSVAFALPAYSRPIGSGAPNPFTQSGPTLDLIFTGAAQVDNTFVGASLGLNFLTQQYQLPAQYSVWVDGVGLTSKSFSDIVTFWRASAATYFDATGTLQTAATGTPRFDHDPVTLAPLGFLIEEARTNAVRNNTMQGTIAGTPGTLPTNWVITGSGTGTLVRNIVGVGTSQGITYIDIQFSGITSTTGFNVSFEPTVGAPAATPGDVFTAANYIAIVGGSTTNITAIRAVTMTGRTSLGAATTDGSNSGDNKATLTSTLQRFSVTDSVTGAATAGMQPGMGFTFPIGVAIDITIRIGLPQLELGYFSTSVIPTAGAAVTRAGEVANIYPMDPWYNQTEGTVFAQFKAVNATPPTPQTIWQLVGTTTQDGVFTSRYALYNELFCAVKVGGLIGASILTDNSIPPYTVAKTAVAIKVKQDTAALNGVLKEPAFDTNTVMPSIDNVNLGNYFDGTYARYLNGHLQRITYYPRRLANYELQALTV